MMSDDQNPHGIANDAEEEMVGKALEVDAPELTSADGKRLGSRSRPQHEAPQLTIEIVGKRWVGHSLIILHDCMDIRVDLWMQNQTHQASGSVSSNSLVELFQANSRFGIGVEFSVATQSLRNALVFVVEDGGK